MPLDYGRIQALCFDVDGTLNDTDDQFMEQAEPFLKAIRFCLLRFFHCCPSSGDKGFVGIAAR